MKKIIPFLIAFIAVVIFTGNAFAQGTAINTPISTEVQIPPNIGDAISFNPASPGMLQVNPGQLAGIMGVSPSQIAQQLGLDFEQLGSIVNMDASQLISGLGLDPSGLADALGVDVASLVPGLGDDLCPPVSIGLVCSLLATCDQVHLLHCETQRKIKEFITADFERHKNWMRDDFWNEHMLPALMEMTSQMSTMQMESVEQESTLTDAQIAGETVNAGRQALAEAQRRFQVDEESGLCTTISTTAGMNAAQENARVATTQAAASITASGANRTGTANTPIEYTNQQIADICEAYDPNDSALTAMCADYERNGDAVTFSQLLNQLSIPVNFGGEATDAQRTLVSGTNAIFNQRPLPTVNSDTVKSVMPALMEARGHMAQTNLASRCYLNTFADTFVEDGQEMAPEMVAHLESLGLTPGQIEDRGASMRSQMQNAVMRTNNPDFNVGLIGTRENTQREGLAVQSLQTSSLFSLLEQQHCSELMSALMLTNTLGEFRGEVTGRIQTIQAQYDLNQGQTKYADKGVQQ